MKIINVVEKQNKQIAVECKIDDGNSYFIDTLNIDTISKYGTEYKVKNLFAEKWFAIPGYENYELSSYGRIKSLRPYGNSKYEKILFSSNSSKNDTWDKVNKKRYYNFNYGGVKLYQDGKENFFLRREIMDIIPSFNVTNDPYFEEIEEESFLQFLNRSNLQWPFYRGNFKPGFVKNLNHNPDVYIVWDDFNCLWVFNCRYAEGYDTWDNFYCFFTNLEQAQKIQRRLNYFQPRLEVKYKEKEIILPPL